MKKKKNNNLIWIKIKILVVVWVIKQGVDFMRDLCPIDLRSELAGIAQLLLSWKMGNGLERLEEVSGFIPVWNETGFPGEVLQWGHLWAGWVFTGFPSDWSRNTSKPSCLPGSVQLTGVGVLGIKIIGVPVSQSVISGSQSHWKSWGAFQFSNWSVACTCA